MNKCVTDECWMNKCVTDECWMNKCVTDECWMSKMCDRCIMLNEQMWVSTSHRFSTKRWMLLKGFELCEIFRLKGVKHHREPVHENIRGKKCWFPCPFKKKVLSGHLIWGGHTRPIRSTLTKCRPSKFIMIQSHERNINHLERAASGFLGWLCPIKMTYPRFAVPGKSI